MPSNPESLLISSILRGRDYSTAIASGVKDEMIRGYADEWKWLSAYVNRHKRVPTKAAFLNQFPDFRIKVVDDTEYFSTEVRTAYARRVLTGSIKEMSRLLEEGDITSALGLIQASAVSVGASMNGLRDSDLIDDWELVFADVQKRVTRFEEFGMAGVPTGFISFDERTGGLAPGQLTIVSSRLGQGKSWTLMRMADAALTGGFTCHYASLEMSKGEVGMRMHNFLSGQVGKQVFRSIDLLQGKGFDLQEYKSFLRSLKEHVKGSLTVSDTRNIGIAEIAAQIEKYNPDVYFLDYLTLARVGGDGGYKAIGDFTKGLKDLAADAQCSIVAAAQLNRGAVGAPGQTPGPENLSGADAIGQDADTIITAQMKSSTVILFKVVKLRHGQGQFGWYAHLDMDRGIFEEITPEQAHEQMEHDKDMADLKEVKKLRRVHVVPDDATGAAAPAFARGLRRRA